MEIPSACSYHYPIPSDRRKFVTAHCPFPSLPIALEVIILTLIKGPPSNLRQFVATEISLKIMKNAFYFTLKACQKVTFS